MTQQDNWQPEMARLAQRQDQLERQQRETTTRVDALKMDVDRRMDSQRRDIDWQFRDGERRVSSLERSRDALENLFWFSMPLVAAVAVIIILVISVKVSREQRQEAGEPEQRSPSSIDAPTAGSGGPLQPDLAAAGTPYQQHQRHPGNHGRRSRELRILSTLPPVKNGHMFEYQSCGIDRAHSPVRYPLRHRARGPCLAKPLLTTRRPVRCRM